MPSFIYTLQPARVIFGRGALNQLAQEIDILGFKKALILSTLEQRDPAEMVAEMLGPRAAAVFDRAVMHVSIEIAREVRDLARKHIARDNGAPAALKSLGVSEKDMDKACEIAFQNQYPNPRPIERGALRQLLQNGWKGVRP